MPSTTTTLPVRDETSWSYRTAHLLAYVLNPLVLPSVLFALVAAHFGAPPLEIGWVVTVGLLFYAAVPLAYLGWLVRRRGVASIEVRERSRRTKPFLVGITSSAAAFAVVYATGTTAVDLITAIIACQIANTVLLLLINLRWKISIHTSSLAGFASTLLFVVYTPWPSTGSEPFLQPLPLYLLLSAVPLLMWARVRTAAHTPLQVFGGALLGLVLPYTELWLLHRYGLFGP